MIKSIELVNWKTHKHTVMNFQKGVNVLIGVMGAGKSSVIDGISFGLFGTFPSLNHKRTSMENLISNRPKIEDSAQVRIKFNIGEDEYTVTRKISKKESTTSKLEKNNNYLQTQTARVNEEIESLIKVDYDTFSRAVYAEQNRLDYFLELTKSERKREIDEMLGLDSFAKAEENTTSLINSIKSLINDEEQMLAQIDSKELASQLEKITKERQTLEAEQKGLIEKSKEQESDLGTLQKEMEGLKSKYEKSRRLSTEVSELSSKVETLKKELKSMELHGLDKSKIQAEFDAKKNEFESCNEKLKKLRKEESSLLKSIAEAETVLRLNQKKIIERDRLAESIKDREPASIEKAIAEREKETQTLIRELSSFKARKDEIKVALEELAKHISKCPICERDLDEKMKNMLLEQKRTLLSETDSSIQKLERKLEAMEKELSSSKREYDALKLSGSRLSEYKGIDEVIQKGMAEAKGGNEKHRRMSDEIESSSKEFEQLNKLINDLSVKIDSIKRKEKYEREIHDSSNVLESKDRELKEMNIDEKMLYALQDRITKGSALLSDTASKVKSNEKYLKSVDLQIDDKAKSIARVNMMLERIESKRRNIGNMNKFRSALIETEGQLRNSLVRSINALMQNIWYEIYPYGDYTGIRLNAKKDDYSLEASVGSGENSEREWVEIEGIASGGEKSVACLTMRIALAMVVVPNLRWLILDEPTHNIDENGISKLIEVLSSSLPKVVEQIFIITHDNALKNISSARVYQLDRNKDKNEYTSIAEL